MGAVYNRSLLCYMLRNLAQSIFFKSLTHLKHRRINVLNLNLLAGVVRVNSLVSLNLSLLKSAPLTAVTNCMLIYKGMLE